MEEYSVDELKGLDKVNKPFRVLVVDDQEGTRNLIIQVLRSAAYEVCGTASDGKMAIAQYKNLKPDLVTMDVQMPYVNGYQALREIIEFDPNAIVLMLTHENSRDTVMKILEAGAKDYIIKPVDRTLVLQKLRKIRRPYTLQRYTSIESIEQYDKMKDQEMKKEKEPASNDIKKESETVNNAKETPKEESKS